MNNKIISGALFDFMGWLTTRPKRIMLSSSDDASPAADAIKDFAKMRGLSLDDARVQDWQEALAEQPAQQALDKKAENARELGLDYEPAQQEPAYKATVVDDLHPNGVPLEQWGRPAQQALDKKAENARELGLDYEPAPENFMDALKFDVAMREYVMEPAQDSGIVTAGGFDPRTQRTWVGLTLKDREALRDQFEDWNYPAILVDVISDMLRERNQ